MAAATHNREQVGHGRAQRMRSDLAPLPIRWHHALSACLLHRIWDHQHLSASIDATLAGEAVSWGWG